MSNDHGQRHDASSSYLEESQRAPAISPAETTHELPKQPSRKRKHSELDNRFRFGRTFSIHTHLSLPSPKAQKLIPRLLLSRSCLPLAYLDPIGDAEELSGSRLFAAQVEILEESKEENRPPSVLIAESAADGRLHAVEKVQTGLYALCRLGTWVNLHALERLHDSFPKHGPPQNRPCDDQYSNCHSEWWRPAAMKTKLGSRQETGDMMELKNPLTARLYLRRPFQHSRSPSPAIAEPPRPNTPEPSGLTLEEPVPQAKQEPEYLYNMIRSQYQEALYASKASLAYFAKGPLSRARAVFNAHDDTTHSQSCFVQFLRSSILLLAMMDTKYRETLPRLVKDLPFGTLSEGEDETLIATISKKIRKSKKTTVGKNGLYPGEELNIARWWLRRDASSMLCDTAESREEATRKALLEQRAKETQMQIILVLETLALEASAPALSAEQGPPQELAQKNEGSQKKSKKPKKQQDLITLLDLLADRLSIWQSMSIDEASTTSKEKLSAHQAEVKVADTATGSDQLRQFCVDVLLPFYAARLPESIDLLCQKLGGPKQPSPRRAPLARAIDISTSLAPGAAVQRMQARKPRRTLERVLTDERSASQRPPSLLRSATEPTLPKLKREVSDVSLAAIPLNRVAMHKRYSQREVDLNAASQATEAKLRKKAKVNQELHSAIAALKKPNPRMAVKELVEAAEKRVAGSHPRKSRNPVRNPFAQGVQIMATPSNNRHKDVFGGLAQLPRSNATAVPPPIPEEIPPSSISRVNDSAKKPQDSSSALVMESHGKARDRIVLNVGQTPTRGPSRFSRWPRTSSSAQAGAKIAPLLQSKMLQPVTTEAGPSTSFPAPSSPSETHATPTKHRTVYRPDRALPLEIEATPIKASCVAPKSENGQKVPPLPPVQDMPMSIYATLGWDDEIDELS